MATPSEVKAGLDDIADAIRAQRAALSDAVTKAQTVVASLDGLAGTYADLVATVGSYGTADAFEAVSKAELAALTGEFQELLQRATTAATA